MSQLSKDVEIYFLGQIFQQLFQFKTQSVLLGHPA